jgi:hypothetical protein
MPVMSAYLPLVSVTLWPGQLMHTADDVRAELGEALPLSHPMHVVLTDAPTDVE